MIEPNRYTAPGEIAARTRVEALFARIDELGPDLQLLPVPGFDLEAREIALEELEALADRRGRGALLDEARQRVRDGLSARMATRQPGYPLGHVLIATGTVEDQVARTMAIDDTVSVAVVEDLLDRETIGFLSAPGRRMLGLAPLDPPGVPDENAEENADAPAAEAMTADDQADADEDDADEAEIEAASAKRQQRVALFFLIGLIVLLIAWSNGIELPMIALILLATALIAWLFA